MSEVSSEIASRPTMRDVVADARAEVEAMTDTEVTSARNTGLLDGRLRSEITPFAIGSMVRVLGRLLHAGDIGQVVAVVSFATPHEDVAYHVWFGTEVHPFYGDELEAWEPS